MAICDQKRNCAEAGLRTSQAFQKRIFDLLFAVLGLLVAWWIILLAWITASIDTHTNGFFLQDRVGKDRRVFKVIKIRTMRTNTESLGTVTTAIDARITPLGRFFRKSKIDELPQLINVFLGQMSFVGPRPDVPGYADRLPEAERAVLLSVRPGITGPATLVYRNEEELLAVQVDPQKYNDEVIYPDKVRINLEYIRNWRFRDDLCYIWKTVFG